MKGFLNTDQIDYVLFHLRLVLELSEEVKSHFVFQHGLSGPVPENTLVFQLSEEPFKQERIAYEEGIPILFPGPVNSPVFDEENGSVVIRHDLLKSSFYLLSGYQELDPEYLDTMGRFPHELSVQSALNFTHLPLVNYYFEMLSQGIFAFCASKKLPLKQRVLFREGCTFVTHDVDMVDTYAFPEVIYRIKQATGLAKSPRSRGGSAGVAWHYLLQYLNVFKRKNPHWDFQFIRGTERNHGIRSTFFFLPRDQKHTDAYYEFSEPRMQELFHFLDSDDCELALHGTVRSAGSLEAMRGLIRLIRQFIPQRVFGVRQHRLIYRMESTPVIQEKAGLHYDTSLGFAEHEGFRNSFCLPFRLFDHQENRMLNIWEIPLNVMDVTLFHYRELTGEEAIKRIKHLLKEIRKFNGVCTLLWHNGISHEKEHPGMMDFYRNLMEEIRESNMENLLGHEILNRVNEVQD